MTAENSSELVGLSIIKRCLEREGYRRIQHYPKGPGGYLAHEFLQLRSFVLKDQASLFRTSGLHAAYDRWMRAVHPRLHELYRIFFLCQEVPLRAFDGFLSRREVDVLIREGLVGRSAGAGRCLYQFAPVDDLLIMASFDGEDKVPEAVPLENDAVVFWNRLKTTIDQPVGEALDIGCGSGFLAAGLSRWARRVTAADINPLALRLAGWNAALNGIDNISLKRSDIYSDLGGRYDLIVSNPPFLFLPPDCAGRRFVYGGGLGVELLERILRGLDRHLADRGTACLLAMSYIDELGTDLLPELVKTVIGDRHFSTVLRQLDLLPLPIVYSPFYRRHRLSHSILYLIEVRKRAPFGLSVRPIGGLSRAVGQLKIKRLNRLSNMHSGDSHHDPDS